MSNLKKQTLCPDDILYSQGAKNLGKQRNTFFAVLAAAM